MYKKIIACLIALTLVFTSINFSEVSAKTIKLNKTKVLVRVGKTVKLKVKGTNKKVKWSTSDKKLATVSKKGVVKGKGHGRCFITAKVGKKKLKCNVYSAHKVAKKISANTMKKLATKMKSKGTYDKSLGCYIYTYRDKISTVVYVGRLKYFPKSNHIEMDIITDGVTGYIELRVGEGKFCKFDYRDSTYENFMIGKWDKTRMKDEYDSITVVDTNAPEAYYTTAKTIVYPYLHNTAWLFDGALLKLKAKVYTEDFGFDWGFNNYFD